MFRSSAFASVALAALALPACWGEGSDEPDGDLGLVGPNVTSRPSSAAEPWEPSETPGPDTPVMVNGALRVEGSRLVNAGGDVLQLRGVSTMWLNLEQQYSQNKEALRWMRDHWDLTVIRAAMAVDPRDIGARQEAVYLNDPSGMASQVRFIVRNAIELGVYVIIDWHDHQAHENVDEAVGFFQQMADEFGEYPNVLYETYNEPTRVDWAGTVKPYHEAVTPAIRERDPDNVVILGTPFWGQAVNEAAADPLEGENLMYTLHFYACSHRALQRAQAQAALDLGAALFATEWGATLADGGVDPGGEVCVEEAGVWHQFMNENAISWTAWKLDDCTDLSCLLQVGASRSGGWSDAVLNGHAPFVRDRMLGL